MKIISYKYGSEITVGQSVVALGFFDGVHLGHRMLMEKARTRARELNLSFGIFTFRSDGKIKAGVERILTDSEKAEIFEQLGADFTVFADFPSISGLSPEQFVKDVLIDVFNVRSAVAGFNYRFGKGASAGAEDLDRLMTESGREAIICEEFDYLGEPVSTTRIRSALHSGDVRLASELLGSPYRISGKVQHGKGLGRKLGFPTLNVAIGEGRVTPKMGVYKTEAVIGGVRYSALTNLGVCPTFEDRECHTESFVLDFNGEIYDENVSINFIDFLREEKRFNSEKELIMQITIDINRIKSDWRK